MAPFKVGRKSFERTYQARAKTLLKLVAGLDDRPTPEQIHDLRVGLRRMQVIRRLLPREVRVSQDSRLFDASLRSVLKATSRLRDLDTLGETLDAHRTGLPEGMFVKLNNERSDLAARSRTAADILVESPAPGLESADLKGRGLTRRLRKRVREQGRRTHELLEGVAKDESKVEELHALRKRTKKLRYLMELSDKSPLELQILTRWQESLGTIHDLDVAISYLQGGPVDFGTERAIREFSRVRHYEYLKFVKEMSADAATDLGRDRVIAIGPTLLF